MTARIFHRILPLAERHVGRGLYNPGATLPGTIEMRIDVLDMHDHKVAHFSGTGRAEFAALAPYHYGTVADNELGMNDVASRSCRAKAFDEAEGVAQPIDGCGDIFVDEDWNQRRARRGPVDDHISPRYGSSRCVQWRSR
jgi:hypothetical protein